MIQLLVCVFFFFSVVSSPVKADFFPDVVISPAGSSTESKTLTLGILSYRPKPQTIERWQPLVDYLNQQLNGAKLQLVPYFMDELETAILKQEVDFIFTQPSHYVLLTYRNQLTSPLAVLVNNEAGKPVASFGGVIFAPASSSIGNLKDLKGKTLATPNLESLGAYQMQVFELHEQANLHTGRDFKMLVTGMPQDKVVAAVMSNQAHAGFVRSGVLESLIAQGKLDAAAIKIINPQKHPNFPFEVSTRLYPEWPFSAMPNVDPLITRQIVSALFNLPPGGELAQSMNIYGFTLAGDYRRVDELLLKLKLPPFEHLAVFSLANAWKKWQPQGGILLTMLSLLLAAGIALLYSRNRQLQRAHHYLQVSSEEVYRLSQAMEQSPEGVLITNASAEIEYVNPAFEAHTGYSKADMLGKNPSILASGQTPERTYTELWQSIKNGKVWRGEFLNRRKDQTEYLVSVVIAPIRDRLGQLTHFLAIEQDVTDRRATESRLYQLANYDVLTGLPNRSLQLDRLSQCLIECQKSGQLSALLLINIDRFKLINDARGSVLGDQVLIHLTKLIRTSLEENNSLARMGADEFSLLIKNLGPRPSQASRKTLEVIQSINQRLASGLELDGQTLYLTISMGATLLPEQEGETATDILARADTALHRAKGAGGNQHQFYEEKMGHQVLMRFDLENDLRIALQNQQLELYLQPQYLGTGKQVGAEALLRWNHQVRGAISPAVFIPLAENTDLIIEVDRWVINKVMDYLEQRPTEHQWSVSVNISPRHFSHPEFTPWILAQLGKREINPGQLILELTEGIMIADIEATIRKMKLLTARGIKFSADDFGTGYSSLAYIKRLPLHELKIDRSFIMDINQSKTDAELVRSIIAVAQCMELKTVIEGVETLEQLNFFVNYPQAIFQGYFFSRPQPLAEFLTNSRAELAHSTNRFN